MPPPMRANAGGYPTGDTLPTALVETGRHSCRAGLRVSPTQRLDGFGSLREARSDPLEVSEGALAVVDGRSSAVGLECPSLVILAPRPATVLPRLVVASVRQG